MSYHVKPRKAKKLQTKFIFVSGGVISSVGKGIICATKENFDKGPQYDFTNVKTEHPEKNTVVQVMMILQVYVYEYDDNKRGLEKENNWYLVIQFMQENSGIQKPQSIHHEATKKYSWE